MCGNSIYDDPIDLRELDGSAPIVLREVDGRRLIALHELE
jgi:hypothetical protein